MTAGEPPLPNDDLLRLLDAGDLDGAVALLDALLPTSGVPRSVSLLLTRGRLLLALELPERAIDDFSAALEIADTAPERAEARLARAEALIDLNRTDTAREDLLVALSMLTDPERRCEALRLMARLDVNDGNLDDGIRRLTDALAGLPPALGASDTRAEVVFDLAQALRLIGEAARAQTLLEELLAWAADRPDWLGRIAYQLGTTRAFTGRFDLAIMHYDQALALQTDPLDRARILYNRAVASRELGDLQSSERDLDRARREAHPGIPPVAFDIELLIGIVRRERGDLTAALDSLRAAVDLAPNADAGGRVRLEIGATLAATGLYGPAIDEFSMALALCTDDSERERAFRYRAVARREMGLPALAIDDFREAVALAHDPNEKARGLMTCAALQLELGRENDAYASLRDALDDDLTDDAVRSQFAFQLGTLATRRGDIDLALAKLAEAEECARASADLALLGQVLVNRGVALDVAGDSDRALQLFRETTALAPSAELVYQAWMNLGRLHTDRTDILEALEAFGRAATAADDRDARGIAFLSRGSAAMRWGRYVEADADFTRVLVLQPSDQIATQARYYRGLTASLLGQLERARDDLTTTIERERDRNNRARALLDRGLIELSAGDFAAAARDIDHAAQSFRRRSDRATALVHLAVTHALQGDCNATLERLRLAQQMDPANDALALAGADPRLDHCRKLPGYQELIGPARTGAPS